MGNGVLSGRRFLLGICEGCLEKKIRNYPERLIHKTSAGIDVRSKSEAMIVQVLHSHKIPFRYECALHIGSITLYPDFTIRIPRPVKCIIMNISEEWMIQVM